MNLPEFNRRYRNILERFEICLAKSFPAVPQPVSILEQSVRYALFAGGKRIRPILLLSAVEATGRDSSFAMPFACAIEYIHTYSLIHDDLPCMDDDVLRRGLPTNHLKFGEDIALLSGDALLTHAFYLISSTCNSAVSPENIRKIIEILSGKAGLFGMVTGQVADIIELDALSPQESLHFIHFHKTGALITASIQMGAVLAQVEKSALEALTGFGEKIGKCFQIQDDILDEIGNEKELGKKTGTDKKNKTLTYPKVYGLKEAKRLARENYREAISFLRQSNLDIGFLHRLAEFIVNRSH